MKHLTKTKGRRKEKTNALSTNHHTTNNNYGVYSKSSGCISLLCIWKLCTIYFMRVRRRCRIYLSVRFIWNTWKKLPESDEISKDHCTRQYVFCTFRVTFDLLIFWKKILQKIHQCTRLPRASALGYNPLWKTASKPMWRRKLNVRTNHPFWSLDVIIDRQKYFPHKPDVECPVYPNMRNRILQIIHNSMCSTLASRVDCFITNIECYVRRKQPKHQNSIQFFLSLPLANK